MNESEKVNNRPSKENRKEPTKKDKTRSSFRSKSNHDSDLIINTHDIVTNSDKYTPLLIKERNLSSYVTLTVEKDQQLDFMLLLFQSPEINQAIYSVIAALYSDNSIYIECSTPRIVMKYLKENGFQNIKSVSADDVLVVISGSSKLPFKTFFGNRLFAECIAPPYFSAPVEILDVDLFKKTAIVRALPIFAFNSRYQILPPLTFLQNTKTEQKSRKTVPLKYDMTENVDGFTYKSLSVVDGFFIIEFPLNILKTWTANFDQRINLFNSVQAELHQGAQDNDVDTTQQELPQVNEEDETPKEDAKKDIKEVQIEQEQHPIVIQAGKAIEFDGSELQYEDEEKQKEIKIEESNESPIPKPDFTQMSDTIEQTIISPGGHTHRVQINIPLILPGTSDADVDRDIVAHPRPPSSAVQDQVIPTLDFRKGNIGRRSAAVRRDREEQKLGLLLKNGPTPSMLTPADEAKQKKRIEKERKRAEKEIEEKRFAEMEKARQSRAASQQASAASTPCSTPDILKPKEASKANKENEKAFSNVCIQTELSNNDISQMEDLLNSIRESMSSHISSIDELHKK